jgi:glutamate-1-semialdehyde 2,1-aminomutase
VLPYNRLEPVREALEAQADQIAAIILEPVAGNMGVVPPAEGFLQGLRDLCDEFDVVLIFDEVITGFRVALGGAQQLYGVTPDLTTLGKIIGGGFPVGAFGGKREIMERLAPIGPVYQAGTLSGNPLATAAGLAALSELTDDTYRLLAQRADRLAKGLSDAITSSGMPAQVPVFGTLVGLFLGDAINLPRNYDEARQTDERAYASIMRGLLDRGVALAPGAYEVMFLGTAHTEDDLGRVIDAAGTAAGAGSP